MDLPRPPYAPPMAAHPRPRPAVPPPDGLESLRRGALGLLAADYHAALAAHAWAPPPPPGAPEPAVIAEFERALYAAAGAADVRRGGTLRGEYGSLLRLARAALGRQWTAYPDEPLACLLWRGELAPAAAADPAALARADDPLEPRDVCRSLFVAVLLRDARYAADRPRALADAAAIETACFNRAVALAKNSDTIYRRNWDDQVFVDTYSAHCGTVAAHLDPASSVSRAYLCPLLDGLWHCTLRPDALGTMSAAEMCPAALEREREVLRLRSAQHLDVKVSTMFRCPHCGVRRCTYTEVQRRSLDEPADYDCVCLNTTCGKTFKGHS